MRIYEYTPGFIHAKCFVADDIIATVGTINLDFRSLYLHFECGVYMYRTKAVMDVKRDTLDTIEKSREIMLADTRTGFLKDCFGLCCVYLRRCCKSQVCRAAYHYAMKTWQ